jgi:hypothetical protein
VAVDLSSIRAFEICSIRPPTENYSLTFRLTRNCYWNRCGFCPAYKFGARFSKRSLQEVKEDIQRAKQINDLVEAHDMGALPFAGHGGVAGLVEQIQRAGGETSPVEAGPATEPPEDLDPLMAWFLPWFKDRPNLEDSLNHVLTWRAAGARTCFLGDADSLILKPEYLGETLKEIKQDFPSLKRFTVYGRTKSAARIRTLEDLRKYREAGLDRIHFGLESGSDTVLRFMNKGVTRNEQIDAGLKTKAAGLSCSVYVMPGLGGDRWSEEHATETADVLTRIGPDYVRLRSLQIFPQTPLHAAAKAGEFAEADEPQVVREIRTLISEIEAETEILSDSASNLLSVNGRLPEDRPAMLEEIDRYLALSDREKRVFSLHSRLQSFQGQYGGLTPDTAQALAPYVSHGRLDASRMPDASVVEITQLIRAKLMP